jgi:hypothetical protein
MNKTAKSAIALGAAVVAVSSLHIGMDIKSPNLPESKYQIPLEDQTIETKLGKSYTPLERAGAARDVFVERATKAGFYVSLKRGDNVKKSQVNEGKGGTTVIMQTDRNYMQMFYSDKIDTSPSSSGYENNRKVNYYHTNAVPSITTLKPIGDDLNNMPRDITLINSSSVPESVLQTLCDTNLYPPIATFDQIKADATILANSLGFGTNYVIDKAYQEHIGSYKLPFYTVELVVAGSSPELPGIRRDALSFSVRFGGTDLNESQPELTVFTDRYFSMRPFIREVTSQTQDPNLIFGLRKN